MRISAGVALGLMLEPLSVWIMSLECVVTSIYFESKSKTAQVDFAPELRVGFPNPHYKHAEPLLEEQELRC